MVFLDQGSPTFSASEPFIIVLFLSRMDLHDNTLLYSNPTNTHTRIHKDTHPLTHTHTTASFPLSPPSHKLGPWRSFYRLLSKVLLGSCLTHPSLLILLHLSPLFSLYFSSWVQSPLTPLSRTVSHSGSPVKFYWVNEKINKDIGSMLSSFCFFFQISCHSLK